MSESTSAPKEATTKATDPIQGAKPSETSDLASKDVEMKDAATEKGKAKVGVEKDTEKKQAKPTKPKPRAKKPKAGNKNDSEGEVIDIEEEESEESEYDEKEETKKKGKGKVSDYSSPMRGEGAYSQCRRRFLRAALLLAISVSPRWRCQRRGTRS